MRESFTAGCRIHDRRANVIRHQCSGVTKSPRSDMFRLERGFSVDVKLADGWDEGQASSKISSRYVQLNEQRKEAVAAISCDVLSKLLK